MAVLLAEVSTNIECDVDNSTDPGDNPEDTTVTVNNTSIDIDCWLKPIHSAGFTTDIKAMSWIYIGVVIMLSLTESVFETVLPVLAGDQVRQGFIAYTVVCGWSCGSNDDMS